jgi:tRNA (mo5U34)-methyltransferase
MGVTLKALIPPSFRRWYRAVFPHPVPAPEALFGCRMDSAAHLSPPEREKVQRRITELGPWFHNYEIAKDIWTNASGQFPGVDYPQSRWRIIESLLPDVRGKACLDVGCSSGFFSLKLKELGASYVLGVDFEQQPQAIEQARFAAETLGLDVDFRVMSVFDLGSLHRRFDVILFMGVFYHLRHPLLALEILRPMCREAMIFQSVTTAHSKALMELDAQKLQNVDLRGALLDDNRFPSARFVEHTMNGDVTCWFIPNATGVAAMLRSCGFTIENLVFTNEHDIIARCKP